MAPPATHQTTREPITHGTLTHYSNQLKSITETLQNAPASTQVSQALGDLRNLRNEVMQAIPEQNE